MRRDSGIYFFWMKMILKMRRNSGNFFGVGIFLGWEFFGVGIFLGWEFFWGGNFLRVGIFGVDIF